MENRAFGALAAAVLLCCVVAAPAMSEPLRVLYAEPFQAQTIGTPGAQKPLPANLRVSAFGLAFELELQDNSQLLRAVPAQTRERIGGMQLLKGTIKDLAGSWVRLVLRDGVYTGAFWDGTELYAIESREYLDPQLLVPMPAAASGIYRLSDTQGGLFQGTCGVQGAPPSLAGALPRYRAMIGELRAAADSIFAASATREIEVSVGADFEFASRFPDAAFAMMTRMPVVERIFSSQLDVATLPADFITFTANTDPFTSSDAPALLNQFANYRNSTPQVRSRGLAHLFTGRELDGNTIGIAFRGSLCRAREGASLSET